MKNHTYDTKSLSELTMPATWLWGDPPPAYASTSKPLKNPPAHSPSSLFRFETSDKALKTGAWI